MHLFSKISKKKKAERFGRLSESCAALLLRVKGYKILTQRFKSPMGEVDIIAKKGGFYIFVEVKGRQTEHAAKESLSRKQQQRIEKAALYFLTKTNHARKDRHHTLPSMRFDVILVSKGLWPTHLENAWRPTT